MKVLASGGESGGDRSEAGRDCALDTQQRALVEKNLGLVGLHIRRNVPNTGNSRSVRDYEDLFQEGCVALVHAARSYDPNGSIPFAAWALPRIHTAISSALHREETLLSGGPKRRTRGTRGSCRPGVQRQPMSLPLRSDWVDSRTQRDPAADERTIGGRVRTRYERALLAASRSALRRKGPRGDRSALVELIAGERLRVPEVDARTPLRQIAHETGSSFARVAECERQLKRYVRRALAGDIEFEELRRMWRRAEKGLDAEIDDDDRGRLRAVAADAFWRRLQMADDCDRTRLAGRMLRVADGRAVRVLFAQLAEEEADELLHAVSAA